MKKIIITALLTAMFAVAANAGKVVTDSIESKILGTTVKYNVYLPDGYGKTNEGVANAGLADMKYPCVYLLHGLYGTHVDWENAGQMSRVADELINSGEAKKMVIFMPCAGDKDVQNIHNGYFNVPGWAYEDFFFGEFIPAVEAKYNCIGDKAHRAIMGLSMGGGGSTSYAQRHSDMFSSCYAMSAWLHNEDVKIKQGEKNLLLYTQKSVHDLSCTEYVKNADENTKNALRSVAWFFDCGDDDFLLALSVEIHSLMSKAGIKNELRVRDGIHNWEYWHNALRLALPFASRNFR